MFGFLLMNICIADNRGWKVVNNPKGKTNNRRIMKDIDIDKQAPIWFNDFINYYNKSYKDDKTFKKAFKIFKLTISRNNNINSDTNKTWWATGNYFSDLYPDDILKGKYKYSDTNHNDYNNKTRRLQVDNTIVNGYFFNWRDLGKVTNPKIQECGDCWAYAAATNLESAYLISQNLNFNNMNSFILSSSQIRECTYPTGGGCDGGGSESALLYSSNNPIYIDSIYPYTTPGTWCISYLVNSDLYVKTKNPAKYIKTYNINSLKNAVLIQPVIAYFAVGRDFFSYSGGIYNSYDYNGCNIINGQFILNHAMNVIGFYDSGNILTSYWIVQNNWGPEWGDQYGTINIAFGSDGPGVCGLYSYLLAADLEFQHVLNLNSIPTTLNQITLTIVIEDTSLDGLSINFSPSFATSNYQIDFINQMKKSKYFIIDNIPIQLNIISYKQNAWFGKDIWIYGPQLQQIQSFTKHTFTIYS